MGNLLVTKLLHFYFVENLSRLTKHSENFGSNERRVESRSDGDRKQVYKYTHVKSNRELKSDIVFASWCILEHLGFSN